MKGQLPLRGRVSSFGGRLDKGMKWSEGLALVSPQESVQPFFRPLFQIGLDKTRGLARQLDDNALYCAMRWDYDEYHPYELQRLLVRVSVPSGKFVFLRPVDWGPNIDTNRLIDVSPLALTLLSAKTDDVVEVDIIQ